MARYIEELLREKHRVPSIDSTLLAPNDLADLYELAERDGPYQARALELLVAVRAPRAVEILSRVLGDRRLDPGIRAAGAMLLVRAGGRDALPALLAAVPDERSPLLLSRLAQALGIVGDDAAIEWLGRLATGEDESVRNQALFSEVVISHRERKVRSSARSRPSERRSLDRAAARTVPMTRARLEDVAALADSRLLPYGVAIAAEWVFRIECPDALFLLALDAGAMRGEFSRSLHEAPLLLGFVAERSPVGRSFSTRWLVLSSPLNEGEAHVGVHRLSGEQEFVGHARGGERVTFEIVATAASRGPTVSLAGEVRGQELHIIHALADPRRRRELTRVPAPFEPPR